MLAEIREKVIANTGGGGCKIGTSSSGGKGIVIVKYQFQ